MATVETTCSFCEPRVRDTQEAANDGTIRIIYPKAPIIPANVMIIPARHVERIDGICDAESLGVFAAVRTIKHAFANLYGTTGINLFVNDGREAGQHSPHIHFHVFGRATTEPISPYRILNNPAEFPVEPLAPDDLRTRVAELRDAIRSVSNSS